MLYAGKINFRFSSAGNFNGKIQVKLYVKSDCEDTAFTAKMMDVTPEGKAYHIRSSITTIAHELPEGTRYIPVSAAEVLVEMYQL